MVIADNTIKKLLQNVYFIWGDGKTATANALAKRHDIYVYHTDDSRSRHFKNAHPDYQPAMCRDVPDFWALKKEDAFLWESAVVREMTPMIAAELIGLCYKYKRIICEGDIDIDTVLPVVTNAVVISNHGKKYDFFARPEQAHMLKEIRQRADLDEAQKQRRIENAYNITASDSAVKKAERRAVRLYGVKEIIRDESTSVEQVAKLIEEYWKL